MRKKMFFRFSSIWPKKPVLKQPIVSNPGFTKLSNYCKEPGLGHKRPDITEHPVLFFRVRPFSYLIVYRTKSKLEIVAVLHGKRNIAELLQGRMS